MGTLLTALAASITTFAATNVDDIFLLTLLFARRVPLRRIVAGQYLGFAAIIAVSLIGAWAALTIPHRWIRLLGLVPVAIGFKQLLDKRKSDLKGPRLGHPGVVSIALLTLSNGADNVGIYIPLFIVSRPYLLLILAVYALLVAALCYVGRWLGRHSLILRAVDRGGHWVVPLVFIALGIYVLGT